MWVINPAAGCHYCPPGPQLFSWAFVDKWTCCTTGKKLCSLLKPWSFNMQRTLLRSHCIGLIYLNATGCLAYWHLPTFCRTLASVSHDYKILIMIVITPVGRGLGSQIWCELTVCNVHQMSNVKLFYVHVSYFLPSALWCCWLLGRKGILLVRTEWQGSGVLICLERGADFHMAKLMAPPLTSVKSRLVLPFWYLLTWV